MKKNRCVFIKIVACIIALIVVSSLATVYSLQSSSVVLPSSGTVDLSSIVAASGLPADIQNAVDSAIAAGGGTVRIPEGDWICNQSTNGSVRINLSLLPAGATLNIIGSYNNVTALTNYGYSRIMPATILRSTYSNPAENTQTVYTFYVTGSADRHLRISGIAILGNVTTVDALHGGGNQNIFLKNVDGFRIDHCYIDSANQANIISWCSKGLVDHTRIEQSFATSNSSAWEWGYGIQVAGDSTYAKTWVNDLSDVQGKYDWGPNYSYTAGPVYVEDCEFWTCRHAITVSQYGYYVARHNVFHTPLSPGMPYVEVHGWGFPSGRGIEVYDNIIYGAMGMAIHGGGGVIFDNTLIGCITGIQLSNPVNYDGSTNSKELLNDMWLWGNNFQNVSMSFSIWEDNWQTEDITYHLFEKDGYVPYQYPHPLTLE